MECISIAATMMATCQTSGGPANLPISALVANRTAGGPDHVGEVRLV